VALILWRSRSGKAATEEKKVTEETADFMADELTERILRAA
jgi:hypothetical protein